MSQILTSSSGGGSGSDVASLNTNDGVATPAAGVINVYGANGLVTTATENTLTISPVGALGILWTTITPSDPDGMTFVINNGYVNQSGRAFYHGTLPVVMAVGDIVSLQCAAGQAFQVMANAGQTISNPPLTGTTLLIYTLSSVTLQCIVANTTWQLVGPTGTVNLS